MKNKELEYKLKLVPKKPGCYLWKNYFNEIIYIGKAKNLYNRVHQYFNSKYQQSIKSLKLVSDIYDLDYITVKNENEALILENNLINKYQPKYNVLLKDTISYSYIVLTNDIFPRLIYTKSISKIKGKIYGPFSNSTQAYNLVGFLNRILPIRKCRKIPNKKCFYYDIKQCLGPCINKNIDYEQYNKYIKIIDNFFKKSPNEIKKILKEKEIQESNKLNFEEAKKYLDLQKNVENIIDSNQIIFDKKIDIDIIGFFLKNDVITIIIFKYINGKLLDKFEKTDLIIDQNINDFLQYFIMQYYLTLESKPKIIYVSIDDESIKILSSILDIKIVSPKKGKMFNALNLAIDNAKKINENKSLKIINDFEINEKSIQELKNILNMKNLSLIEIYDTSHIFNQDIVGVKVAYKDGQETKELYRKYIINIDHKKSDYYYIAQTIKKRFKNYLNKNELLPNLIIVDGGIIQINAAISALKEYNLDKLIKVIGLAKNNKHKTNKIVFENNKEILIDKNSIVYNILFKMQEEVHRFAISFHKQKHNKSFFKNIFDEIKGLGKKRQKLLLERYESLDNIKKSNLNELKQIIPEKCAKQLLEILEKQK